MWRSTGLGLRSITFYFVYSRNPVNCGKFWVSRADAHSYADDLQIYAHSDPKEAYTLVASFSDCVDAIKEWMASNRSRLNPDKTEVIWLGSPRRLHHCPTTPMIISGATIKPSIKVRNLGVTLDSNLSMTSHVNKLISMCFFLIRQLRLVRRSLTVDTAHALVRSMIHITQPPRLL